MIRKNTHAQSIFAIIAISILSSPSNVIASGIATPFNFRAFMPADGNCEGVAWKPRESLGSKAYASWDARKGIMWIGIKGKVYQSSYQNMEGVRLKVIEADYDGMHAIITIPQQTVYDSNSYPIGTLELLSNSSNKSLTKIEVSVGQAC